MLRKLLSLLSDVAVYGISSLLSQIIGFLLLPVYTRFLSPADQGVITQVLLVTAFFGPLANLGMINAIFRRFNVDKEPERRTQVLSTGLFSVTLSSLALLAVTMLFAGMISRLAVGDESAANLVRLSLLSAAASSIGMVPLAILRADRRTKTTAAINVSKLLISVCSTIYLVVVLEWNVWGVVVGTLVGEMTMLAMQLVITFRSFRFVANIGTWKLLAAYGLPFVPHQIQGMTMGMLPQFVVGPMLGLEEAGLYATAVKFTMPVVFVVNAVQNAWIAYKFQIHAEDEDPARFFSSAVTYYVAGIVYLWVGVSLWGPEMVWLLTEQSYYPAAYLIPIAGLIPVSQGIYFMMGTGMELSDDTRPFPLVTFVGLVTAIASIFLFVPRMGATGAAVAAINSFIALTIVIFFFSQRRFPIRYDRGVLLALLVIAVAAVCLGRQGLSLPLAQRLPFIVAISLIFPVLEFGVLLCSSTERHRMKTLWSRAVKRRIRPGKTIAETQTVVHP